MVGFARKLRITGRDHWRRSNERTNRSRCWQFNVDILAEDENGHKVVIENQLENTDHDHLGKLITYASGLQADVCVWLVARARQEHEQAINWLNENTTEGANFFLN